MTDMQKGWVQKESKTCNRFCHEQKTFCYFKGNVGRKSDNKVLKNVFLHFREVYHTKRMQHVITVKWTSDSKYILCGSDEMNIRLWKANASEKLGVVRLFCYHKTVLGGFCFFVITTG